MKNTSGMIQLRKRIQKIIKDRDWAQFHNYKDLAISLNLEAAEVLEHFQWKSQQEMVEHVKNHKEELSDEIADVLIYLIELSDKAGIDLLKAANNKLDKNEKKYPISKVKGTHKKYNEL